VRTNLAPSSAPVVEKAQQEPHDATKAKKNKEGMEMSD
jgi:hypothetical protein